MSELFKTIDKRISIRRNKLGYSQEYLAELTNLHRNYIGNIERAEKHASVKILQTISKALGLTLEELFKDF